MSSGKSNPLARIPGVDTILGADEAAPLIAKYGHTKLVQCIRDQLAIIRAGLPWSAADFSARIIFTSDFLKLNGE